MFSFILKAAFSGLVVALVTVVARRHPGWGGLLAALPITSVLAISLLWAETHDPARVEGLAWSITMFIVPSLPLFVVLPLALRGGLGFWPAMGIAVGLSLALYALAFWMAPRIGVRM